VRRLRITGPFAFALLLGAMAVGHAQAPAPVPLPPPSPSNAADPPETSLPVQSVSGFVSPYEIMRTLRSAGFDPLAPPLREGTTYVARANDYRGILMRVVLDARTGAIRDANRIVPGPGNYGGPYGSDGPGPYGQGSYGQASYGQVGMVAPPYGQQPDFDDPPPPPNGLAAMPNPPRPVARTATRSSGPPLPRPRPGELATSKAGDTSKPAVVTNPQPAVASDPKPDVKADPVTTGTVTPAPSTPPPAASASPPAKPGKVPPPLPINN
jgi:hypothetical protein